MFNISKSFARRQSLYICGVVAILFLVAAGIAIVESVRQSSKDAETNAYSQLDKISLQIENILSETASAVDNVAFAAISELSKDKPNEDKLFQLTKEIVERNDMIVGSILSLPEYYLEGQKFFAAYSAKDSEGNITSSQVGNEDYDYHAMDWYLVPKLLDRPYWTDPYFDAGAGNIRMCTYSKPLKDDDGRFLGVLTADLPIDWLSEMVNSIKPYKSSYNLMIGKDAAYIVHTDVKRILRETIFTATYNMTDTTVRHIGREMIAGNRGSVVLDNDDTTSMVFYTPIPVSGWSVAMVCPHRDIYAGTHNLAVLLIFTLLVALLIIFLLVSFVIGKMTNPLHQFSESARKIASGDFNAPLPEIKSQDEMFMLRESFGFMQTSLTDYIEQLKETTSVKERIESELNIARDIQMSMVPKVFPPFPDRTDIDIYAFMQPAKEVGGDLYDFFIDDDKLYFAIGDVSGKGVPASLFMAMCRSIFRSIATSTGNPAAIMSAMSNAMCDGNDTSMFVTLFIGVLDLKTLEMTYSNAGHNPPVLISSAGGAAFLDVEHCSGVPVGLFADFEYKNASIVLAPDDKLVLYTDGLTEAENKEAELYSDERMMAVLSSKEVASMEVRDLLENMLADVEGHVTSAAQSDDLTIMVMHVKGGEAAQAALSADDTSVSSNYSRLELRNEIPQLAPMAEWIEANCEKVGASAALAMNINLALEEAVTNVIMYAYPDTDGSATFFVDFDVDQSGTGIWRIVDLGRPFNPLAKQDADITQDVMERPVGGLGIFMVKTIMDEVTYSRENGQNILTMKINMKNV